MGASGWHYFVPYDSDINGALNRLREEVFKQGKYYKPALFYEKLLQDIGDQLESDVVEGVEKSIEEYRTMPEPESIDELIEMNAESGTHSIIDMHNVGSEPGFGTITPMPENMLIELFQTACPNHSQVEKQIDQMFNTIRSCYYLLVYEDDIPKEIFFIGFSGD